MGVACRLRASFAGLMALGGRFYPLLIVLCGALAIMASDAAAATTDDEGLQEALAVRMAHNEITSHVDKNGHLDDDAVAQEATDAVQALRGFSDDPDQELWEDAEPEIEGGYATN